MRSLFVRRGLAALVAASFLALFGPAMPASAAANLTVSWSQETGTAPFDTVEAPGNDTSNVDGIVRTNDKVVYRLSLATTLDSDPIAAPKLTITFPLGFEKPRVPEYCLPGSTLTNNPMPAPDYANITATTYQSLPHQTLTCLLPDIAPGQAVGYSFTTTVRPELPNGYVSEPAFVTVESQSLAGPVASPQLTAQVSAAPKYDISINGSTASNNTAFVKQGTIQRCTPGYGIPTLPSGQQQWCWVGGYPVTVSIPNGGLGGSPMAGGDFTYQINTDPVAIWGQAAIDAVNAYNAANGTAIQLPGGYLTATQDSPFESANSRLSQGTPLNSVRESGASVYTQPGGQGQPIIVHVTDADTTGYTRPTDAGAPAGYKLRTDRGFIYTQRVFVEVPLTDIMNNSAALDGLTGFDQNANTGTIAPIVRVTTNESGLSFQTIAGLVDPAMTNTNQYADPTNTRNNYRQMRANIQNLQPVYNHWDSPAGYATATEPIIYAPGYPAWYGPSGPAGLDTGDGVAVKQQQVISTVSLEGNTIAGTTTMVCHSFDNSKVVVDPTPVQMWGVGAAQQAIGPVQFPGYSDVDTGGVTWISGSMVNFNEAYAITTAGSTGGSQNGMADRFGLFRVQYGVGDPNDATCTQPITWSDTMPADPTTVNKVRIYIENQPGANVVFQRTSISIGMKVIATVAGTVVPTFTNYVQVAGVSTTFDNLAAMPASTWVRTTYDPALDTFDTVYDDTGATVPGRSGDKLTVVESVANLNKTVESDTGSGTYLDNYNWIPSKSAQTGANGEWVYSATDPVPIYGPGEKLTFTITPTLVANPPVVVGGPREHQDILIEDCLPRYTVPDPTTTTILWNYSQTDVTNGTLPYEQQLICDPGEFYIAWYYPNRDVLTDPLRPKVVGIRILETAFTGERTNEARITVGHDTPAGFVSSVPSNVDQRTAIAKFNVEAPDGLRIAKSTNDPVVFVDPYGWVSTRYVTWNIVIRNLNAGQVLSDVDAIDFLPENGVNGSSFTGSGAFYQAVQLPPADGEVGYDNVTILYTAAVPTAATYDAMNDPASTAYNGPAGSTGWCSLAADGTFTLVSGTGACPTQPADVTGIRVLRPGEFPNSGAIRLAIQTDAQHNVDADVMHNTTVLRVTGIAVPVTSATDVVFDGRDVPPNTGLISGFVWDDYNSNGMWDWTDANGNGVWDAGEGEPPMAGVEVHLHNPDGSDALDLHGDPIYAITRADGTYTLVEVLPGTYEVHFHDPDGYSLTLSGGTYDSLGDPVTVTLDEDHQFIDGIDSGWRKVANLDLTKTVTGASQPTYASVGDVLTYTVQVVNNDPNRPFTDQFPARFIDDLADVADNGTVGTPTATSGTVDIVNGQLVWYGPLGTGETATITYPVTVDDIGDGSAVNVAFVSDPPVDPDTGLPEDPTPTEPVTPPATCTAPDCATTTTPLAAGPDLDVAKTAATSATPTQAGDTITYTITATNNGDVAASATSPLVLADTLADVLDDASYNGDVIASSGTVSVQGTTLVWHSEDLAAGASATITYSVTVTAAGNLRGTNVAFVVDVPVTDGTVPTDPTTGLPVDPGTGQPVVPPTPGQCSAPDCATTTTPVVKGPNLDVAKQAVASASPTGPGATITYTLTATNNGDAAASAAHPVTLVDSLAGVLDDGTLGTPTASTGTVRVVGDKLVWTSTDLAAGASATITYTVTVTGNGDKLATNVVFVTTDPIDPGTGVPTNPGTGTPSTPPVTCAAPDCATTTTQITLPGEPMLSVTKSVASSMTPVDVDAKLTYTVKVTNSGQADFTTAAPATLVDDLSGVLDDGIYLRDVQASAGTATLIGNRLVWTGVLAVGQSATITYSVQVTNVGDHVAKNVAFSTTAPIDPGTGLPTDPTTGKPIVTPSTCTAPLCASTSTPLVVKPLPRTGADTLPMLALALVLLGAGGVLLVVRKRLA